MTSLESVEASRRNHQQGMEHLYRFDKFKYSHPLVALYVVHKMIEVPGVKDPAHGATLNVLEARMSEPGALDIEEPSWFIRNYKKFNDYVGADISEFTERNNSLMWLPAMDKISQPVGPIELELPQLVNS
jgi:hypothetical protein